MTRQILEGSWEEICAHEAELAGKRLKVIVLPDAPPTLGEAVATLTHRTPEEIAQTQRRLLQASPPPRPLPDGMTLAEAVMGKWPGTRPTRRYKRPLRNFPELSLLPRQ